MLLHGWTATADLNFFECYEALGRRFRVLAFDHRGHGDGLRTRRRFSLEDCADDTAAVLEAVGIERAVIVGYSMGGTVAQLVWRRHRERVAGLVLSSTAAQFSEDRNERLSFAGLGGLAALARVTPDQARRWLSGQLYLQRKTGSWQPWAVEQVSRNDWRMVLEAGRAIGRFRSAEWLAEIDVPTAVIITMQDEVVPLRRQIELVAGIPGALALRIDAGHDAAVARPGRYVPLLLQALRPRRGRPRLTGR